MRESRLEGWKTTSHMKFDKSKSWILHVGWSTSGYLYRLGNKMLESNLTERDLGVMVNNKLNMSQQYALDAKRTNRILGHIKHSIASQLLPAWDSL